MQIILIGIEPNELCDRLAEITYRESSVLRVFALGGNLGFQYGHFVEDVLDPDNTEVQFGGVWYIDPNATLSESVQRVFLAVRQFEEHELREAFRYRGAAIFGPHLDCDALVEIVRPGEEKAPPEDPGSIVGANAYMVHR